MAITDNANNASNQPDSSSQKNTAKSSDKKTRPPTKVVIRRLPPDMDKETFLNQIAPVPEHDYLYLVKGDSSLGEYSFSRAYINFINVEDIFVFKEKFDNYVFIDQKGHEYPAVVEFAAFQKIPKKRRVRPDPKCGTIESDPYYQEFLESLKEQPKSDEKPEYSYQLTSESKEEVNTTPLLEYVKQKKMDRQRTREERREERRKKEIERKKFKEEERKRYLEEKDKSAVKNMFSTSRTVKSFSSKPKKDIGEKAESTEINDEDGDGDTPQKKNEEQEVEESKIFFKNNRKFYGQDREKGSYYEKKSDYRFRRDDYKEYGRDKGYGSSKKYDDYKKNIDYERQYPKKVKKYSAIREERRNEIKKQEQKKSEPEPSKSNEKDDQKLANKESKELKEPASSNAEKEKASYSEKPATHSEKTKSNDISCIKENSETNGAKEGKEKESKTTNKENDPRAQRRIRNKDRPTMAIYQPGMLSKRKQVEGSTGENANSETKTIDDKA